MTIKLSKSRSFEQIARTFWDDLVSAILVPGEYGYSPSEGEMLCAYNDMKSRHPECECIVQRIEKSTNDFFEPGNKIGEIRIIRRWDAGETSVEFIQNASTHYVRFQSKDVNPFSLRVDYCDLPKSIKNFEEFIEKFPEYTEKLEKKRLEYEKKLKIEKMTESSIRASVSQVLKPMGYGWSLTEREHEYLLKIFAPGILIGVVLNARNFAQRIAALPAVIVQMENLFNNLTFPIQISITI